PRAGAHRGGRARRRDDRRAHAQPDRAVRYASDLPVGATAFPGLTSSAQLGLAWSVRTKGGWGIALAARTRASDRRSQVPRAIRRCWLLSGVALCAVLGGPIAVAQASDNTLRATLNSFAPKIVKDENA